MVAVERQLELAAAIPGAIVRRVAGGHSACTIGPDEFVPQLVGACLAVAA